MYRWALAGSMERGVGLGVEVKVIAELTPGF